MALPFLDTNFLLPPTPGSPSLLPMATAVIDRIEQGAVQVRTSDIVISETVYTLERSYKQSREQIAFALLPIIDLPGIILPGKRYYRRIFVH